MNVRLDRGIRVLLIVLLAAPATPAKASVFCRFCCKAPRCGSCRLPRSERRCRCKRPRRCRCRNRCAPQTVQAFQAAPRHELLPQPYPIYEPQTPQELAPVPTFEAPEDSGTATPEPALEPSEALSLPTPDSLYAPEEEKKEFDEPPSFRAPDAPNDEANEGTSLWQGDQTPPVPNEEMVTLQRELEASNRRAGELEQDIARADRELDRLRELNDAMRKHFDNREQVEASARRARALQDENARADRELERLRELNDGMKKQIKELELVRQQPEEPQQDLPAPVKKQLGELADRYPESYRFDPQSGVSLFDADVLFDSGSDELRGEALGLLSEFAAVFQQAEARGLQIHIDGHTDNRPISRPETAAKHPTNWHLSIHRAASVRDHLQHSGLSRPQMHVAGHSMFRPIASNDTPQGRQLNRRVEIRVQSPDEATAWELPQRRASATFLGGDPTSERSPLAQPPATPSGRVSQSRLRVPTAVQAWRASGTLR